MTVPVLHSFAYALDYLREQLADVSAAEFATPAPGLPNHPAWVVGHLTFISQMLGGLVDLPPWLPGDFEARFGTGSTPADDSEPKSAALARLADAQARLTSAVEQLPAGRLDEPFPDPAYRDVFPTIRHALTQILVGHTSFHVGQISAWRRAMGLPRLARGFE